LNALAAQFGYSVGGSASPSSKKARLAKHDITMPPQISVITAVFNSEPLLEHCLLSVSDQVGVRCEHIVIDGGSTDGSLGIIHRYSNRLSYWSSEPDRGIGDAMNKGIMRARGEWLLFLHADDYLLTENSLSDCYARLQQSDAEIMAFPIHFGLPGRSKILHPRGGDFRLNFKTGIWHQACFIRRSLFNRIGGYDVQLRIAMDYEFFLRAWRARACFETTDGPAATFMRSTGISSQRDWQSLKRRFSEERTIHLRHARAFGLKLLYFFYWPAYLAYRWSIHQLTGGDRGQSAARRHE